jgi:hypothetical protein
MTIIRTKFSVYISIFVLSVFSLLFFSHPYYVGIVLGIVSSLIILLVDFLASQTRYLRFFWLSIRFREKNIRLSVSYLFKIKIDNRYLLIRGKRFPQYQPVGGVFKRYKSSVDFFQNIQALDDNLVPIDEDSKEDLRIRLKGKYLVAFMKWFDNKRNREISGWREFYEEMIKSDILPQELFPFAQYQFVRRHENPVRYSDFAQSYEILIAEIYELIVNHEQENFLRRSINKGLDNCIWVSEDEILRRGALPGKEYKISISEHSKWIL